MLSYSVLLRLRTLEALNLFKRLTAVSAGPFYRLDLIVAYSSGKVVTKSDPSHR